MRENYIYMYMCVRVCKQTHIHVFVCVCVIRVVGNKKYIYFGGAKSYAIECNTELAIHSSFLASGINVGDVLAKVRFP